MEPRISPLDEARAPEAARPILQETRKAIGRVPNLHRALAHAPAALQAYVETARALASGALSPRLREQIAVATAGLNGCVYCASAHTALGKMAGLSEDELDRNLRSESGDPRAGAALAFVRALVEKRGAVSDAEWRAVREAGFEDAEIVEIIAHVGMSSFTNMFNVVARTPVDFPEVELSSD